jgi:hypothetical protein
MQPVAGDLDIELGYVYDSAAIAGASAPLHEDPRTSHARPGARAPHAWLARNGARLSTLDLFGPTFTLFAGPEANRWREVANDAASRMRATVAIQHLGAGGLQDSDGACRAAYAMSPDAAVLIRPDGFVAWRSDGGEPFPLPGKLYL